jgi:hypothetical protein
MKPSIDLLDDENQLLLIGVALLEQSHKPPLWGSTALLEKLAGEEADEFRRWARSDLELHAQTAVEAACTLTAENWIEAPCYVDAVLDVLRKTVRTDLDSFHDRLSLKALMQDGARSQKGEFVA